MPMTREESIHWASDVLLNTTRTDEFIKEQDPDIIAHALAMALFRYMWFRLSQDEEERRENFFAIAEWMMKEVNNYKPDWGTAKVNG